MSKRRILTVLLTASAVWLPAALRADDGETVRPVFSAYTLEAGSAHIADTYLTPLKYNGQHFGIDYQRWQAMKFDPQRWVMQLDTRLTLNHTVNPAGNATMWDAMLEFRWGMMRRWRVPHGRRRLRINQRWRPLSRSQRQQPCIGKGGIHCQRHRLRGVERNGARPTSDAALPARASGGRRILLARLWRALLRDLLRQSFRSGSLRMVGQLFHARQSSHSRPLAWRHISPPWLFGTDFLIEGQRHSDPCVHPCFRGGYFGRMDVAQPA